MPKPIKPRPPPLNRPQFYGVAWALAYGVLMTVFHPSFIPMVWASVACIVVALARLRGGEVLALVLLTFASLMGYGRATGDMKDMPQGISVLIMLFGAPFVLRRGYVARKNRTKVQTKS